MTVFSLATTGFWPCADDLENLERESCADDLQILERENEPCNKNDRYDRRKYRDEQYKHECVDDWIGWGHLALAAVELKVVPLRRPCLSFEPVSFSEETQVKPFLSRSIISHREPTGTTCLGK
jgi:hypothetical protein